MVKRTLIFTGTSGGGKTTALRAVEDLGFYCVDNLPLSLISAFNKTVIEHKQIDKAALVIDARLRSNLQTDLGDLDQVRRSGDVELVYLEASDSVLISRFSQTRRRHPLQKSDLLSSLAEERRLLEPLHARAVLHIDTSALTVHQLKRLIQDRYREEEDEGMLVSMMSFGFRFGTPSHADLIIDVRFLKNPYFVSELRLKTGLDGDVAQYVMAQDDTNEFLKKTEDWLRFLLPRYRAEGKSYLTIAIGCTGGRHRSVALAEELSVRLQDQAAITTQHRDVER